MGFEGNSLDPHQTTASHEAHREWREGLLKSQAGLVPDEQGWLPGCLAEPASLAQHTNGLRALSIADIHADGPTHAAACNGHTAMAGHPFGAYPAAAHSKKLQTMHGCAAPVLAVQEHQIVAIRNLVPGLTGEAECLPGMANSKPGGWHALGLAVKQGQTGVAQQVLQALSSDSVRLQSALCGRDSHGSTALDCAVSHCNGEMVRLLLSVPFGTKAISIPDRRGWTPLHRAAFLGETEIVAQLIEASAAAEVIINLQTNDGHTALMLTAGEGHAAAAHQILKVLGSDLDVQTSDGGTALSMALEGGHAAVIHELLKALPLSRLQSGLHHTDGKGRTLLHHAVLKGKADVVRELLSGPYGPAALNIADADGRTPLHTAALQGHAAVVVQLLQSSFASAHSINAQDWNGLTPLMHASQQGHPAAASVLLAHPACRRDIRIKDGRNALSLAAHEGHHDMVQRLLEALRQDEIEVVVCNQDQGGCTPLHHAAQHGDIKLVELLLSRAEGHAAMGMADAAGSTPLNRAACDGHALMVACLLRATTAVTVENAINMQDRNGCTPLMSATRAGHASVVDELIRFPACQANICDSSGCTALSLAAEQGCTGVVQKLLEAMPPHSTQAALHHRDALGWTPLHAAAQNGRTDAVRLLLSASVDAAAAAVIADEAGWTPLHQAAFNGHASTVSQLLQGAHHLAPSIVNTRKANGFTALMDAAQEGHSSVVAMLCATPECNLDASSNKGSTALSLAAEKGYPAVVQQLLSALQPTKLQLALSHEDAWGCTPLHRAAQLGKVESIQMLLAAQQASAAIARADKVGWTPLHTAAHGGHALAVACLLRHCQSAPDVINHKDKHGFTALMVAASEGRMAVLRELLMEPLCRLDAKSHLSHRRATAFTLARLNQQEEAAQLLAQAVGLFLTGQRPLAT